MENMAEVSNGIPQIIYLFIVISIFALWFVYNKCTSKSKASKKNSNYDDNIGIYKKTFDIMTDGVIILSDKNEVMYANKSLNSIIGLQKNFLFKIFKNASTIYIDKKWIELHELIKDTKIKSTNNMLLYPRATLKLSNGTEIPVNLHIERVETDDKSKKFVTIVSIENLIKEKESSGAAHRHQLTDLPNQNQVILDLPALYSKVHIENNKIALVLLSIDSFSEIRASIGYDESNKVLIKFAKYLNGVMSTLNISVYHTFDNYFLLMLSNMNSIEESKNLVKEIQHKLTSLYQKENINLILTVSAGISVYPDSGKIRQLLDRSYIALSKAESAGSGNIEVYMAKEYQTKYDEITLSSDMIRAFENDEFEVYYQPIVESSTLKVVEAESLVRWRHPVYGLIAPDDFIPLMEKSGYIVNLGQYVLEEVLKQQKRWEVFKFKNVKLSINLSMIELMTEGFIANVKEQISVHSVDPALIKFELTESMATKNEKNSEKHFKALKNLGVGISLDDFGTGYTSFGYLKNFPADTMKIDKSLIKSILKSSDDQNIVKAMIDLGHSLGKKIVVEGIESEKVSKLIISYGADYMQGYYFAKPLPVFEFQKLLR